MAFDLDSVLLDRVFQPASDRCSDRVTCFGLARGLLGAAALLQVVVLAADLQTDADVAMRTLSGVVTIAALFGVQQAFTVVARAERQSRPGLMNIRRITLRWQRSAWLALSLWSATAALCNPTIATVAVAGTSLCWLSGIYFASCTERPPSRRRSAARAPFGLVGSEV